MDDIVWTWNISHVQVILWLRFGDIWLFNLFFKYDGEEAQLLFQVLCTLDVSGFWVDKIFWWLYILDSSDLLILLSAWIVSVLDIIGDCDCDIKLFPTFLS